MRRRPNTDDHRSGFEAQGSGGWPRATFVLIVIAALAVNAGCTMRAPTMSTATKPSLTPALFETGRRLYEKQCAVCHGPTGAGDGPAAYLLYPKPRDFTSNEFRLVSTGTMQATDDDLFLTITRGMPGSAMPSWETLTPQERWALVSYVRHLTGVSDLIDPASIIQVPPETPKTPESIARGRDIFAQACASCHGPQGKGDGQQLMQDNQGYPVRPRDLTAGVFKGSSESKELYYRIMAGLPGSPMPSYAGIYTDEQLWDLVHYVQSLVPPGVEERVRLRRQTIRARRVRGDIPSKPSAEIWNAVQPVAVAVTPLWWRDQRIDGIDVKALHNGKELAIHLSWNDPTRDDSLVGQQAFSDGIAAQLSTEPDPPFFGMGGDHGAVSIWHWKAAWQQDLAGWRDIETVYPDAAVDWYPGQRDYRHGDAFEVREAKTTSQDPSLMAGWAAENPLSIPTRASAAEEAAAKGLGTLTSKPLPAAPGAAKAGLPIQRVQASGDWREGRWRVVLQRPLVPVEKGDLPLQAGQKVSVAFAVWDGQAEDRDGQKSVSVWQRLQLER
ncbi:MAG: c-type cytochrome [Candidatus Omnitrophica bacterium]|nr:c-type cytochrome [Candidatus Omnitrophota bacterium]MBI3082969.1 c-type cytochrome [Candidatus Omnitrophota bacterium]